MKKTLEGILKPVNIMLVADEVDELLKAHLQVKTRQEVIDTLDGEENLSELYEKAEEFYDEMREHPERVDFLKVAIVYQYFKEFVE